MYLENKNKIYPDNDTDWIGNPFQKRSMFLFYPRKWNPLFWILVFTTPVISGIGGIITRLDETSHLSSFFYGMSEASRDICNFFHRYKV